MKLTCSKDLLLQYINIVNKAVSNRTTLPILECILLTANERGFIMTGNDLEIGIRTAPIEAEIQEAGEVAIEARIFNEIVRRLNLWGRAARISRPCRRWNRKGCILWSRQSCAT